MLIIKRVLRAKFNCFIINFTLICIICEEMNNTVLSNSKKKEQSCFYKYLVTKTITEVEGTKIKTTVTEKLFHPLVDLYQQHVVFQHLTVQKRKYQKTKRERTLVTDQVRQST